MKKQHWMGGKIKSYKKKGKEKKGKMFETGHTDGCESNIEQGK